jgi:hypothetical protein
MTTAIRIRRLIAYYGRILAVLAILASIAAFGLAYDTYQNPSVDRVTRTVDQQSFETRLAPSAVVTGNTTLYRSGQRLENRSAFLTSASPVLTLELTSSSTAEGVTMDHRLVLELRATLNDRPFWSRERVLATDKRRLEDGQLVSEATIDVREIRSRLQTVREEIGEIGTVQARLRVHTTYESERYDGALSDEVAVQITENAYWLDGEVGASRDETRTRTFRQVRSPNPVVYGGFGLLGLLTLAGGIAIILTRRRGIDVEALEADIYRDRYEEWISNGEFPTGADKRYVTINSLEDLVDIAIDCNKRVIFDDSLEVYAVADGDIVYYYSENTQRLDSWLDL